MLTIPTLFFTTTASGTPTTTFVVHALVSGVCTDFDHDAGQASFSSGQAILFGVPFVFAFPSGGTPFVTSTVSESPFFLTMSVVTGTFNTVNSVGSVTLGGSVLLPFMSVVDPVNAMTLLAGSVTIAPLTSGPSGMSGTIQGEFSAIGASTDTFVSAAPRPVSLTPGCV